MPDVEYYFFQLTAVCLRGVTLRDLIRPPMAIERSATLVVPRVVGNTATGRLATCIYKRFISTCMPARWPMTRAMPARWPMTPTRSFEVNPDVPSNVSRLFVQLFHNAYWK
uniref:Secreted protein n=1 Tax=Panagrellus redivivus TaxID=6233 RepID=A0A7E4V7U3_PANRE